MIVNNTPVEVFELNGVPIHVKREELCAPYPGPAFSKIRGVYAHMKDKVERGGVQIFGVLDTVHSKAGWAVAYVGRELGVKVINFYPRYLADNRPDGNWYIRPQQVEAYQNGATLVPLQAGRSAILFHQAKKLLAAHGASYMMPNALKLPESVTENAAEAQRTAPYLPTEGTVIVSLSSGTVAAGILKGLTELGSGYDYVFHLGYSRSEDALRSYIREASGLAMGPNVRVVDEGYAYADAVHVETPFPCNPHYDKKAWKWLAENVEALKAKPIIFWNIGA